MKKLNTQKGKRGERIARTYLADMGYFPVVDNYRSGKCEIDLIMLDATTLVIVEVKARSTTDFGRGAAAVDEKKQEMLRLGAFLFCQENNIENCSIRFDVVEVDLLLGRVVEHLRAAF